MKWTFGIITDGKNPDRLEQVIASIGRQADPAETQIIVVGGEDTKWKYNGSNLHLPFDESEATGWITRKKNLITQHAEYENIAFMHDYVSLGSEWCVNFNLFGDGWKTCMTRVLNKDGSRFRDWCVINEDVGVDMSDYPPLAALQRPAMMSYFKRGYERWQYYSGAFFCAKKEVMEKVPFNEKLCWAQGEDVEWSRRVFKEYGPSVFKMNQMSYVVFLKDKPRVPWQDQPEF